MYCKECGNEIKDNDLFCTNCGTAINEVQKNNKLKKYKIPIITIVCLIIICIIIEIKIVTKKNDNLEANITSDENNMINSQETILSEKMYITQNSDVSPTGKEFIGVLSDNLTDIYNQMTLQNENIIDKYYMTSAENIEMFTSELWLENRLTNKKDKVYEQVYYYNTINNNIIASRQTITALKEYKQALLANENNYQDATTTSIHADVNVFQDLHNHQGDEEAVKRATEYYKYSDEVTNTVGYRGGIFYYNNSIIEYKILAYDILYAYVTFPSNTNKEEILMLAYDENSNPEEIIKKWYSEVIQLNGDQEGIGATNNNDNSSSSNNGNTDNNLEDEPIIDDDYSGEEDEWVSFILKELENKSEEELKSLLSSNGLIPKVVNKTEEIAYSDDLANTTKSTVEAQLGNEGVNIYRKGDTVEITTTYYKPAPWTATIWFSASNASFRVNGKDCLVKGTNAGTYCFFTDPRELDSYFVYATTDGKGVEFYINNKFIYRGTNGSYGYTFDGVDSITLKLVAPYVYEYTNEILEGAQGNMVGTNVIVYEKQLNVKELYKSMRGNTIELEVE